MPSKIKKIKTLEGACPQCCSRDLNYDAIELQDSQVRYPFVCNVCHYEGSEWYSLDYITTI